MSPPALGNRAHGAMSGCPHSPVTVTDAHVARGHQGGLDSRFVETGLLRPLLALRQRNLPIPTDLCPDHEGRRQQNDHLGNEHLVLHHNTDNQPNDGHDRDCHQPAMK